MGRWSTGREVRGKCSQAKEGGQRGRQGGRKKEKDCLRRKKGMGTLGK